MTRVCYDAPTRNYAICMGGRVVVRDAAIVDQKMIIAKIQRYASGRHVRKAFQFRRIFQCATKLAISEGVRFR